MWTIGKDLKKIRSLCRFTSIGLRAIPDCSFVFIIKILKPAHLSSQIHEFKTPAHIKKQPANAKTVVVQIDPPEGNSVNQKEFGEIFKVRSVSRQAIFIERNVASGIDDQAEKE